MKRIITTIFAATLLLTGCGQVGENAGTDISDSELYTDAKYNSTNDDVNYADDDTNDVSINVVFKGNPIDISDTQDALMDMSEDIINTYCIVGLELQEALYSDKINQYFSEGCSIQIQYPSPKTFELKGVNDTKSLEISKATILINTENNISRIGIVCDANEKVYHLSDESAEMIVKYLTDISSADTQNSNSSEDSSDKSDVTDAKKENQGSQKAMYKRMAMVNGVVYVDTGYVSGVTGRCGTLDGSFGDVIGRYDMPEKEGQINFQADGWQVGFEEDTIEIPTDDGWCIFAAYGSGKYSQDYIPEAVLQFTAIVEEVRDNSIIVKADSVDDKFQGIIQENSSYEVSLENYDSGIYKDAETVVPGNSVTIVCKGNILETYPAVISDVYKISPVGGEVSKTAQKATIEGYEYEINSSQLTDIARENARKYAKRGYMIDSENKPNTPYYYFIFSGEKPTPGYSIDVDRIDIDAEGNVTISVEEQHLPGDGRDVPQVITYPFTTVSIYPKPQSICIVDSNGNEYECLQ